MRISIIWWNLDESTQTVDSLNQYLKKEDLSIWKTIKGLHLKFWISDPIHNHWGAVMLLDPLKFKTELLPPNQLTKLIGYPPTSRFTFDVANVVASDLLDIDKLLNGIFLK